MEEREIRQWIDEAKAAREKAYTPYSRFKVGCALILADGRIQHGCNIENAAYGPTNCAERTAMFAAVASGEEVRTFRALAVIGDTEAPITPCGVCRQVMAELCAPNTPVILANLRGDYRLTTVADLLPGAFHMPDEAN